MTNFHCDTPTNATHPALTSASLLAAEGTDLTLSPGKSREEGLGGKLHLRDSDPKAQHGEDPLE